MKKRVLTREQKDEANRRSTEYRSRNVLVIRPKRAAYQRGYRRAHPEKAYRPVIEWGKRAVTFMRSLKNSPCMDCGGRFPPECMDFDHARGEKKFALSAARTTPEKLMEEAAKCDLVCANCHRTRTAKQRQKTPEKFWRSKGSRR